jgi:EAL domain-containing protein (putative c-di-GMP-specific phosphodiesterase class I)
MAPSDRLLVVDDDALVRELLRDAAQEAGFATAGAGTREEFAAALAQFAPAVVVLDLTIPGADVGELLRDLAATGRRPAVVLVSGQDARVVAGVERLARTLDLDVRGVLGKPLRITEFWTLISGQRRSSPDELAAALERGELELFFQPKVGLEAGGVVGAEALLRWNHPTAGLIGPCEFVPLAEESGLIAPLTEFAVRGAARQARQWRRTFGGDMRVAVNFSPALMLDPGWPDRIGAILAEERCAPEAIIVELAERAAAADPMKALEIATRLRLKRIALALDVGAGGAAGAAELWRMPLEELKLDRSLVADIDGDDDGTGRSAVAGLVGLARDLRLDICAAGVESRASARFLRTVGCTTAQGYLYSRPVSAGACARYVERAAAAG